MTGTHSHHFSAERFDRIIKRVQLYFEEQTGTLYLFPTIKGHIITVVETHGERVLENDGEMLTLAGQPAADELRRHLEAPMLKAWAAADEIRDNVLPFDTEDQYNGGRIFSPDRFGAMVVHFAYRAQNLFPTKLNKLLFYADFSYYQLRQKSMSGSEYLKNEFGPAVEPLKKLLAGLANKKQITLRPVNSKGKPATVIVAKKSYRPGKSILSKEELRFLDWVIQTYGPLTTTELVALSHREMAYWETHWKQPIDYKFANDLETLPPKSLLENSNPPNR